jgi:putative membrane protein
MDVFCGDGGDFGPGERGHTPLLKILSCPRILPTFGLFIVVINAFTLMLASALAMGWLHIGSHVDRFMPAPLGSLIVSIVSMILTAVVREGGARV